MDPELCEAHKKLHRQFEHFGESPVFILLRTIMPEGDTSLRDFPLQAWQGSLESGIEKKRFMIKPYESERIAIEDSQKDISGQSDKSMVAVNLTTALNSVELLKNQVKTLINVVKHSEEI